MIFPNVAAMRERTWKAKSGYTYGLHGTPTTFMLEERLCELDGGKFAVLAPSGLAAIALVNMALLKPGDEVLLPDNVYVPNLSFARTELKNWGISHQLYAPSSTADLASKINAQTRLVWIEAAGSITLEFPDLLGVTRLCRERGITTALDHTWGAGVAYSPLHFDAGQGADISVHALTKYPSGGGDILMGSVVTSDEKLHHLIKGCHMRLGLGVGANDVEAVMRGLPSLHLRYAHQDESSRQLAHWCQAQPEFSAVFHPALPESPGHRYWLDVCPNRLAAGLVTVALNADFDQPRTDKLCDDLQFFKLGYSWAGPISLVVPYEVAQLQTGRNMPSGCQYLLRFSVGLERVDDLISDLSAALRASH